MKQTLIAVHCCRNLNVIELNGTEFKWCKYTKKNIAVRATRGAYPDTTNFDRLVCKRKGTMTTRAGNGEKSDG